MKISSAKLCAAIDNVANIIDSRHPNPTAQNLLLLAKDNELTLVGTNLDERCTETLKAEDDDNFSCCLNPAKLKAAAVFAPEFCELSFKDGVMQFKGGAVCRINTLDADAFPPEPKEQMGRVGVLASLLAEGVQAVSFAMSKDGSRPILQSVHFKSYEGEMLIEANDGSNGAYFQTGAKFEGDVLIHDNHVRRLISALRREGATLHNSNASVLVLHQCGSYWCKTMEGNYPNTDMIRNDPSYQPSQKLGEFQAAQLGDSFRLACAMSSVQDGMVPVDLKFGAKQLVMEGENFKHTIKCNSKPFETRINARRLAECCDAVSGSVQLATGDLKFLHLNSGSLSVFSMPLRG